MLETHKNVVVPPKEESEDTSPKHGSGGHSTCSTKPKCGAKTRAWHQGYCCCFC
jgi:hypothetical protein